MKLTLLASTAEPGKGSGRYAASLATALARCGLRVELLLPENYRGEVPVRCGLGCRLTLPAPFVSFGWRPWRVASLVAGARLHPEGALLHSLVEVPYSCLAHWMARRHSLPYLVTLHGSYAVKWANHPLDRLLFGRALRGAASLVAVSSRTAERLRSRLPQAPVEVIPNGVDIAAFESAAAAGASIRAELGLSGCDKLILSVGALKRRKGVDTLLEAFALVRAKRADVKLLLVGSGDPAPYRELARRLGVAQAFELRQRLPDEELRACYHAADLFVLLPRELPTGEMEGFGLVYLEAAACSRPCVGTRSGGVPEAVLDGQTGLLVPPDHPEEAARALLRLLEDEPLARRLGENGRRHAEEHSWDKIAGRYAALYDAILRRAG